ncbi:alpha-ribazole phosphatase [Acetobacterium paludosum]|uniref:Alpha-ribazole phosphatase n=1 Tax=Acetobacterium paludosum TaxID=52693 RepID=A0A923KV70_9FIRM|nr:alpha-ribazole phosphatase [Acetobacterium paludosum]MBC3887195.1 alpha-ribazole phosphatase [Acetobacterium paludosum]
MVKQIYLIRHGKIEWNQEKAYIGQTELLLSKEGIEQAEKLQKYFSNIPLDKAYTSPMKRCQDTLAIILAGRTISKTIVDEFKEISMGDWEGKPFSEIKRTDPDAYEKRGAEIDRFTPPNGESFLDLQQRVMPAFYKIIMDEAAENIIILGHSGVNRVILSTIFGLNLKEILKMSLPYGSVKKIYFDQEKEQWNYENG